MRKAGLLLAISSLPSNYGIGDFGENCYKFIDYLKSGDFKIWQILPLNKTNKYMKIEQENLADHFLEFYIKPE